MSWLFGDKKQSQETEKTSPFKETLREARALTDRLHSDLRRLSRAQIADLDEKLACLFARAASTAPDEGSKNECLRFAENFRTEAAKLRSNVTT